MGDYNRSTREMAVRDFPPEIANALDKHLESYNLGNILVQPLICVEVVSEKIKKGLFSGPGAKLTKVYLVITSKWLVEVIKADNDAAFARSIQLQNVTVMDYEKSLFYAKAPDCGVEATGIFTDTSEASMSFIGLGKDEAGEKFKKILIETAQEAKR